MRYVLQSLLTVINAPIKHFAIAPPVILSTKYTNACKLGKRDIFSQLFIKGSASLSNLEDVSEWIISDSWYQIGSGRAVVPRHGRRSVALPGRATVGNQVQPRERKGRNSEYRGAAERTDVQTPICITHMQVPQATAYGTLHVGAPYENTIWKLPYGKRSKNVKKGQK